MLNGIPFSILVVDDDEDDRIIIDEAFKEIGYEAEIKKFIDGYSLLRYLKQIDPSVYPSLIVLDNTLDRLAASDILSALKTNPGHSHIPVVFYTGSLSPAKKAELLSKGAFDCLEKGSVMHEIVEVAKKLKAIAESKTEGEKNK
jgi:CheY-like chemotaxis protein